MNDLPRQMWVEWMKEIDPNFVVDSDPKKCHQLVNWRWFVDEALQDWDG